MSRIKLVNIDFLKNAKVVEVQKNDEYIKLQNEADKRINKWKREEGKVALSSVNYIAGTTPHIKVYIPQKNCK